jgi:hypothetical protein
MGNCPMRLVPRSLQAAEYWLVRANEAVVQAAQMRNPHARRELLQIAEGYIGMAMLLVAESPGQNRSNHRHN